MTLTIKVKLNPSKEQAALLDETMALYIRTVNEIVDCAYATNDMPKLSSKVIKVNLPSALKDQCRLDAASIYNKWRKKGGKLPVLKKPVAIWNNQNYEVGYNLVTMPVMINGKCKKIFIPAEPLFLDLVTLLRCKRGTMRISKKNGVYYAQVAYEAPEAPVTGDATMGVDLGIKCPAVARTSNGKTKFFGNGRQNKQKRRYYKKRRKVLGKAKKLCAIKKIGNKEQRWMKNQDHVVSRQIINFAIANNVKTIKLESLSGIRQTARTSRKNNHSLHNWSFYRLANFIEYKAALAGIEVVYIDPAYTSQTCPHCKERNHASDRHYVCKKCGFKMHRDIVGAVNILAA